MAATEVKSSIAGLVSSIEKKSGDPVAADDAVLTVECMKMYIPITAPVAGMIISIEVQEGDVIAEDQLVFVIDV